jgi:hypothetical protein
VLGHRLAGLHWIVRFEGLQDLPMYDLARLPLGSQVLTRYADAMHLSTIICQGEARASTASRSTVTSGSPRGKPATSGAPSERSGKRRGCAPTCATRATILGLPPFRGDLGAALIQDGDARSAARAWAGGPGSSCSPGQGGFSAAGRIELPRGRVGTSNGRPTTNPNGSPIFAHDHLLNFQPAESTANLTLPAYWS